MFAFSCMQFNIIKLVVPTMTQQRGGIIVNVSSETVRWDVVGLVLYDQGRLGPPSVRTQQGT
jgi:NADP-dependent 3-hydroxy acid dehydrogenase YdfG